jgi:IclR family acetate operon transcriptional repressor
MPKPVEQKPESTALRTFSILEHVARAAGPVSLDDVTQACKLPKPTVFRMLTMLVEADLLRREPLAKRYTIGARLPALAFDVLRHSTLRSQPHDILRELVDTVGETCNLTILDGDKVLYLDRVETPLPLRLHLEPGMRVPLHCTASGKLFLVQMSQKQIERLLGNPPFKRYTRYTITQMDALHAELDQVRETMVGLHRSELFDDSVAIAVPLTDATERIYAALALHAPSSRVSIESCMGFLPALRSAAARISVSMMLADARAPAATKTRRAAKKTNQVA